MLFQNFVRIPAISVILLTVLILFWPACSLSGENPAMEDQAEKKVQTDDIFPPDKDEDDSSMLTFFNGRVSVSLVTEMILNYLDIKDESDQNSGDFWDGYLGSAGLGLNIKFNQWLMVDLLAELEDVWQHGSEEKFNLSEAFATLRHPDVPVYMIGGKMSLPFGVFEDHMISGTITEDLYEIDERGLTLGLATDDYGLDLSFTVYKGQDVIEKLVDWGTHEFSEGRHRSNSFDSFILHLTVAPIEEALQWHIYFNSEPGDGRRNQSIGSSLSVHFRDFAMESEYITALVRENGADEEENLESAWFLGLAYQPADALEFAMRYERFADDRKGDQDEIISYRCLAGVNYEMMDVVVWSLEYRYTRFERETGSEAAKDQNEITLQLAIGF